MLSLKKVRVKDRTILSIIYICWGKSIFCMKNIWLAWVCAVLVLSIYIWHIPDRSLCTITIASSSSKTTPDNQNSVVSVSASVTVQVGNQTLKAKDGMLRSSIINFLSSGPNVLKTPETDQPDVKSKIVNQINNVTQNVQGSRGN